MRLQNRLVWAGGTGFADSPPAFLKDAESRSHVGTLGQEVDAAEVLSQTGNIALLVQPA